VTAILLAAAVAAAALAWPLATARAGVAFATVFYMLYSLYKVLLIRLSVAGRSQITVTPQELADQDPRRLPRYSILVPMYREPETVPQMVKALDEMDYPEDLKDVQFLIEEDDSDTRLAFEKVKLPEGFRITVIPPSKPRTKPKACNVGLSRAMGELLVIYDAEDRPEPDQLRKAVVAFTKADPTVVCLQSRLNFYNPRQNLLTRWFTAEYSAWFDMSLPGLGALNAVIPLGGTSNHFKTAALRDLLGWDAFNVTEDCDLGIRIYRAGRRTAMMNATTWEEACSSVRYWIPQRTRWLKGYIQTYLVHMRNPLTLLRELGPANFLQFHLLVGGVVFSSLINPIFWLMALSWFVFRSESLTVLFPGWVFVAGALCLFAGNFVFAYTGAIGCYRRGYFDLVAYALLSPVYWIMMSVSAWRAAGQFLTNPFHWEKTRHGLFMGHGGRR
jgi:cellulose synthase/poly-beta-1,6-N-acetylglucosamine synthase-like glycosyltransferase